MVFVLRQRVPAELEAHDEEPEGEGEAHGADGDAGGEAGTDERAEDSADNEVDEQRRIEAGTAEVKRAADEGEAEAKGEVGADDAACVEGREAKKRQGAKCSCAGGGPMGSMTKASHFGELVRCASSAAGRKWR